MDPIDRQAAIDVILGQAPEPHYPSWYAEQIKNLPSAQQEIIRCKDCKHRGEDTFSPYCEKLYRMGVLDIYCYMTSDDDFCSMAERR